VQIKRTVVFQQSYVIKGLDAKIDQLHIFDKNDFLNGFNVSNILCFL